MSDVLGLRGRLAGAMVAVGALTLVVTALLLLIPLDRKLRQDVVTSLEENVRTARPGLAEIPLRAMHPGSARLQRTVHALHKRTGADAALFDAGGRLLATSDPGEVRFPEVSRAIRERRLVVRLGRGEHSEQAQVALPVSTEAGRLVIDLRRSLEDLNGAMAVVQRSLLAAAFVAIGVALLAGLLLAGRLARRLIRLRDGALRVAELGPGTAMLHDGGRDEVGDLTRAFATMQQRLEDQERARRTFVSTASHELRTPLTSLRLMLHAADEELADGRPDVAEARDQVGRALTQTVRLGRLAGELLDLSRIDAGLELRAEPVELRELAGSVLSELGPRPAADAVPAVELSAGDPTWAVADPSAVARIARILLDNAVRHAGGDGRVDVRLRAADGMAVLEVADSGAGVAAEDAERIFRRFERGPGAADDGRFGLGLAIGRELARQMGGDLRLCEARPGATFALTVPLAGAPAGAAAADPA